MTGRLAIAYGLIVALLIAACLLKYALWYYSGQQRSRRRRSAARLKSRPASRAVRKQAKP